MRTKQILKLQTQKKAVESVGKPIRLNDNYILGPQNIYFLSLSLYIYVYSNIYRMVIKCFTYELFTPIK